MCAMYDKMVDASVRTSRLNFGDLAGSEDVTKALGPNPDPERLKEAIAINSSLSALTTAISMLSRGQRPSFRSSALTHILQDSLGGNSKTTMVVNASPHIRNRPETIRTLRFAETAKKVKNKAKVNDRLTRAQLERKIVELESENAQLKAQIVELEQAQTFSKPKFSRIEEDSPIDDAQAESDHDDHGVNRIPQITHVQSMPEIPESTTTLALEVSPAPSEKRASHSYAGF
ncbi:hypothetical protein RFI_30003, partial [Reticulomyxa filosa]